MTHRTPPPVAPIPARPRVPPTAAPRLSIAIAALLGAASSCRRNAPQGTPPPSPPRTAPASTDAPRGANGSAATTASADTGAPPAQGGPIDPPAAAAEFRDAAQWLPQGDVAGWRQSGTVTRSTAANLFQIIDGAAALFEEYGVRNFAKTDYRRADSSIVLTAEVYEFATPLGAFGRYTRMLADGRDPATLQSQGVRVGGGGYQGTTQLTFWKGRVLVQVSVSDSNEDANETAVVAAARESLTRFGEAIASHIEGESTAPESPLPQDGLVWGGATYFGNGVFGVDQSGAGWIGHYRAPGGQRYRVAVMTRANATDAQRAMARLRSTGAATIAGLGDEAFTVRAEAPNGEMVVARAGGRVVAVADGVATGQSALDRDGKVAIARAALAAVVSASSNGPSAPPGPVVPARPGAGH